MCLPVMALALILVTASGWSSAFAQGSPSREAPVGYRQPKASEAPLPAQDQKSRGRRSRP